MGYPVCVSLPLYAVLQFALMSSNNSAPHALAHQYPDGFPPFHAAVRAKIAAPGLKRTTIDDPTASPLNASTASDVSDMVNAAARYPAIARATTDFRCLVPLFSTTLTYPCVAIRPRRLPPAWPRLP